MTSELIRKSACEIVDGLRAETLNPHHLLDALEERIAVVEPAVNALPTLAFERGQSATTGYRRFEEEYRRMVEAARKNGRINDPHIRQGLARYYTKIQILKK